MKKKLLSLILAVILMFSAVPIFPAFAGTVWDGSTKNEPAIENGIYQIGSGDELAWFAEQTKTNSQLNAVLTDDIDLGGKEWTPIGIPASGYVTEAFSGVFDGQGHTISGLHINTSSAFYGLFYCVYGGIVKNLNVIGNITTTGNTAGGIVGKLQGGTVENCSFDGSVTASKNYVGGIVGNIVTNNKISSIITGCCNFGEINGKYAGGILGYTTAKAYVTNCYNTGTINGTTRSAGISGQQTAGTISYCYNIGSSACGISAFSNADITSCYYLYDETVTPGGKATGYEKITDKATLLDLLNAGNDKQFCEDSKNKNNGYPVFNWQNKLTPEEEAAEQKKKEDTERVKKAVEELSIDTNTVKKNCTLNLPSEIGDCSVKWKSSNTDIISNDGTVTLPDKNIVNVTLTAKITYGEISDSKEFTVSVWSENIDANVYLQTVLDEMKWNFKQLQPVYGQDSNIIIKFQTLLKSKGFDGITITMNSTSDESLITKNGKIIYPALDENSYANGKQVRLYFNLNVGDKTVTYPTSDLNAVLVPWDTSNVKNNLEKTADDLLKDADLSAVTNNLDLPSNIGRNEGKYSFAWIEWKSSDENHLAISDENRNGSADALYNSYIGKIYQDELEHNVTLTATITNPSTDVAITRSFNIIIPALSDYEINQNLDMMRKILDYYTADKLTDFATKQKLDISAVDNDIQLVIPSKVVSPDELEEINYGKHWDYWNYKFSVTSSDTDVIEINSFRAYVYRPLGENSSADKKVTLTVKIASKENPNLFVTKDIDVTIKHLSRQELNDAMGLMDAAKMNYAGGLLGSNTDAYSVIDNLTPYREIVWNTDKSDVDFVYTHSDVQGNGIIVDTLPNWEEQEDWRLFRTSNKDLISNETLILNQTPADDTFVKINSVLTDETLGKYYTKFCNDKNYDIEALAKFKQLYKQPVSAYVMVVGADSYTKEFASMTVDSKSELFSVKLYSFKSELDKPISVTFTLLGLDGASMIPKTTENSFTKGATVFDVFKKMIADNNMYYSSKGSYISAINGLAEKDYGGSSGWMYSVDGVFVNSYMNAQELNGGENIVVMYVRDYKDANKQLNNNPNDNNNNQNSNQKPGNNDNQNTETNNNPNKNNINNQNEHSANKAKTPENNNGKHSTVSVSDRKNGNDSISKATDNKTVSTDKNDTDTINDNPENSNDSTNKNTAENNDNKDTEKNNVNWKLIIPIIIGVILLILIIVLIIFKKRKTK